MRPNDAGFATQEVRTAHILVFRLYAGDATSQHTFMLARIMQRRGIVVSILCQEPVGPVPSDIQTIASRVHYADYVDDADLTILQYPIWYPLAERFRTAGGVRVFWYHGVTPPELWSAEAERDILRTAQTRTDLARHAHLAVAASPFTAVELQQHAGLMADQVAVVALGVDVARFAATPSSETLAALRRKWNLLPVSRADGSVTRSVSQADREEIKNQHLLLFVGRVAGNKRLDLLIDGLAALRGDLQSDFKNVTLLIVGDTQDGVATQDLVRDLKKRAHEKGVGERVIFTGRVDHVEPYFHLADLYLQSSQHEGFGAPLVEAMAAGTPVIAGNSAATPWVLGSDDNGEGGAGLTFVPGDLDDLVRQLRRCLLDPTLLKSMAEEGRQRARDFDIDHFEARAWAVLQDACDRAKHWEIAPNAQPIGDLAAGADVMRRDYRISSSLPLIGRWVAWLRGQSTVHIKEAYLDRILERQVNFNRLLAHQIAILQAEVDSLDSSPQADGHATAPVTRANRRVKKPVTRTNGRTTDLPSQNSSHADRHL